MGKEDSGIRRYQIILGILFAVASAIYLLTVHFTGIDTEVVNVYFPYADTLAHGSVPEMEYPQFALVFMAIPRVFASTPFGYNIAFVAEVFVFFMIGLIVTGKLAKRYYQSQRKIMLIYTILMLLMFEFVVDRYDIFPAVLTLTSLYCFVTKKYAWAFLLLSIATMTKLYPAVLFPIYLFPFIINRDWSNALKSAGVFVVVAILIILPFYILDSGSAFHFLTYHMDRPLQIESTPSAIISVGSILGLTNTSIGYGYGSDNLVGSWPDAVTPYMTYLMLLAIIAIYVMYAYLLLRLRKEGQDNENNRMILLGGAALLSILAFIIFGKVFSSQYLIWIIPFIAFMMMTSIDHTSKLHIMILSGVSIALTQLNFAVNIGISGGGAGITDAGMIIILARDIVMLILFAYVIKVSVESVKKRPWRGQSSGEDT